MLFRFITNTIFILFFVLNSQLVFAHPPIEVLYDNISEKREIELEIGNEYKVIGSESEVLVGIQKILYFTSIQEEFGYSPTNEIFIDQPFDDRFFYGLEVEVPMFRDNIFVVSEVTGEFDPSFSEKPIYSKTGVVYEVNDQVAFDCGFEVGVNDPESSKAIIFGITFTFQQIILSSK